MSIAERIRADIEHRIRSGEWRPGRRIPFEHELVTHYGCARATVGKALGALAHAGLIERRRKAGSFVAHPRIRSAVLDIPDIGAVIAARGEAYRFELVERTQRSRGEDDGEACFAKGEPLLAIRGVHFADNSPFGFEERVISLATVPAAREAEFAPGSPGSWLLANVPWTDARHRISAVAPSSEIARALDLPPGTPCLQVERWTWRVGSAVTFARQTFPGDRYDLTADFAPAGSARPGRGG